MNVFDKVDSLTSQEEINDFILTEGNILLDNNKRAFALVVKKGDSVDIKLHSSWLKLLEKHGIDVSESYGNKNTPFHDNLFISNNLKRLAYKQYDRFLQNKIDKFSFFYSFFYNEELVILKNTFLKITLENDKGVFIVYTDILENSESETLLHMMAHNNYDVGSMIIRLTEEKNGILSISDEAKRILEISEIDELIINKPLYKVLDGKVSQKAIDTIIENRKKIINANIGHTVEFAIELNSSNDKIKYVSFMATSIKINEQELIATVLIKDRTSEYEYEKKLKELTITDSFTNLYNRRYLYETDYKKYNTLYFIDMNNLKKINDKYGHIVGDEAILSISNYIKSELKKDSIAFRYAGDEFIVLSMEKTKDELQKTTTRFNTMSKAIVCDGEKIELSVAIGYSIISDHRTLDECIISADLNMYDMKQKHKS